MASASSRLDELHTVVDAGILSVREAKRVASPRTVDEVAAVLRHAHGNNLAVEIAGAGTKREWGRSVASDLLLDMTRLGGLREHSWQDLTVTVAAGTPWTALQRSLAKYGQQVALDPLWPETATVGGVLATNDSGAWRLKYGSLRDLVIGMTIVLADGTVAKSGGKVVKNVAGYDLHKLMIGAYGTLGVIAEVTFRLHPLPSSTRTWSARCSSVEAAGELMMKMLDSHLSMHAVQLCASSAGCTLDVELAGSAEVLPAQIETVERFAQGLSGDILFEGGQSLSPFGARQALFSSPGGVVLKMTMLPSAIARLTSEVVRLGGRAVSQASGIMFARFDEQSIDFTLKRLSTSVTASGDGSLTILRGAETSVKAEFFAAGRVPRVTDLMHAIKRQFDPKGVLNAGRLLEGL